MSFVYFNSFIRRFCSDLAINSCLAINSTFTMKRKHGEQKFPEILEKIRSGEYTARAPTDTRKYSSEMWTAMRMIFDEENNQVQDHFYCSKCNQIFNLVLRNSGQSLKRHVEKLCKPVAAGGIDEYFLREYEPASGMITLLSALTFIGSKYGHITEDAMRTLKLIPSRQTVSFFFAERH